MKILLIENDLILLQTLKESLQFNGNEVLLAENAEQGWELFVRFSHEIDAILTDIKLPGMNGVELVERLRQTGHHTPVIIMTGYGDLELCLQSLRLGAFDFILKPFELKVLHLSLDKLSNLKWASKEAIETHPYASGPLQISIPTQLKFMTSMIATLQGFFNGVCKLYDIDEQKIGLCLQEALTNAIIHGNLDIASSLKEESWEFFDAAIAEREKKKEYAERRVFVRYFMGTDHFAFEVEDQGQGFNADRLPKLEKQLALMSSGRGLIIIKAFMDEVIWSKNGSCIRMVKYLKEKKDINEFSNL